MPTRSRVSGSGEAEDAEGRGRAWIRLLTCCSFMVFVSFASAYIGLQHALFGVLCMGDFVVFGWRGEGGGQAWSSGSVTSLCTIN